MYERLQVIFYFLKFWSAIVRTYERLQVFFFFLFFGVQSFACTNDCKSFFVFCFVECNRSHVRTIASHIERSEGMDRWSWSYAPHKNPLVMGTGGFGCTGVKSSVVITGGNAGGNACAISSTTVHVETLTVGCDDDVFDTDTRQTAVDIKCTHMY